MMVVALVMAPRSAHHAFDAANNAPGHSTDNAAIRRANRASRAPTFGRALLGAANNALSLRNERHRKSGKNDSGFGQSGFHEQTPCLEQNAPHLSLNCLSCCRFLGRPESVFEKNIFELFR
jgi:hypothetical protein